MRFFSLFFN